MTSPFERLTRPQSEFHHAKPDDTAQRIVFQARGVVRSPLVPRIDPTKLDLTPREKEILDLSAHGLSANAIATRLSISPFRVKQHQNYTRIKFRVHSTSEAIRIAIEKGEISPQAAINATTSNDARSNITHKKRRKRSPYTEKKESLKEKQREILQLLANVLDYEEIALVLKTTKGVVRGEINRMYKIFGVHSSLQAVLMGIDSGIVNLDEATKDYDLKFINLLTPEERDILEKTIENHGAGNSNAKIAEALSFAKVTIKNKRTWINSKLGVKLGVNGNLQAALMYLAAKRRGLLQEEAK